MKKRTIKLQAKHMPDWRNVGTELRFGGRWLRELGFEPGETVEITATERTITIKPIESGNS